MPCDNLRWKIMKKIMVGTMLSSEAEASVVASIVR